MVSTGSYKIYQINNLIMKTKEILIKFGKSIRTLQEVVLLQDVVIKEQAIKLEAMYELLRNKNDNE